jgi:arabinose-5-phosphate isomerase
MILKTARHVLDLEASAIRRMAKHLDAHFVRAVNLIHQASGPAIVIGMGKPAIIGEKISASLASTGTASFTLHPADALHGDIGRVTAKSVVIMLSNSGETSELLKLLPLLKSSRCKLIAITGNIKSSLAKACDVVLDTSVTREARPLEAVPTVSTTCMLAMGDALVMALVRKRKFKENDFARLHPGGSLGKRLRLSVKDVMRKGAANPCVKSRTTVKQALLKITQGRAGSATIVNSKFQCIGIFTDGDLRRHFKELIRNPNKPISEFMTHRPRTVHQDTLAMKALEIFQQRKIDEMPVVNSAGKVTGLLDVQDLLAEGFVLPA